MAISILRRIVRICLAWAALWTLCWALIGGIVGLVDPDSIDSGEGAMSVVIFGPMGLFSGIAFAALLTLERGRDAGIELSTTRVIGSGVLGVALVQLAYLGHGDRGLVANVKMALLCVAIGGFVTLVWLAIARTWSRLRSSLQAS